MNRIVSHLKLALFACMFFSLLNAKAGEVVWMQYLNGSAITTNAEIRMSDFILRTQYSESEYDYKVSFIYGREAKRNVAGSSAWTFTVDYTLEFLDQNMVVQAQNIGNSMTISYDPSNPGGIVYEAHKNFVTPSVNYEKVRLKVNNISAGTVPDDVRLELSLICKTSFAYTGVAPLFGFQSANNRLYWSYIKGADYYHIEWVYIDDEDVYTAFSTNADAFAYREPVRVVLKEQYYDKFNFTYPKGKVYFRVRGVGKYQGTNSASEMYTSWYYVASPYVISTTFESAKNWQYVTTYSEDAKFKKVITYYDGSTRSRQVLTNLSSENVVIGGESKYDYEGRPVVSILPVPVGQTTLAYVNNMNSFSGGKADYDKTMTTTEAAPLTALSSKASFYYSLYNPDINTSGYAYIPDAEGYPYSQILYTRDGTNRPLREAGVGKPFHLSAPELGGKNTAYKYSTANDTELHRLFGSNVGDASHYKKNYEIDPNGQINVSYLDQEGRVVATCLTGNTPSNLDALSTNLLVPITVNLKASNTIDKANKVSKNVSIINNILENTVYTFDYNLKGVINQSTLLPEVCKECVYDLVFTIKDPDDVVVYIQTIPDIRPDVVNCGTNQYDKSLIHAPVTFQKVGEYQVIKELRLTSSALDVMLQNVKLEPGYPSYDTYEETYMENVQIGNCDLSCEDQCRSEILRRNPTWAADQVTYASDISDSVAIYMNIFCPAYLQGALEKVTQNECKSLYDQMVTQIRPGGYYNVDLANAWLDNALAAIATNGGFKDANGASIPTPSKSDIQSSATFKDDWVDELVGQHREYCHYKNCLTLTPSRIFDKTMATVKDWTEAAAKGYVGASVSPLDFPDPMFDPVANNSDAATGQARNTVAAKLAIFTTAPSLMFLDANANGSVSLEEFVGSYVPYGTNTSFTPDPVLKWRTYRAFYQGLKITEERKLIGAVPSGYTLPGSIYTDLQAAGYQGCPYTNDENTIVKDPSLPSTEEAVDNLNDQNMMNGCYNLCPENAKVWLSMIENNCAKLTTADYNAIYTLLTRYCTFSCGYQNPMGLLLTENLTDPNLVSVQQILDANPAYGGCSLSAIALEDPHDVGCKYGIELKGWNMNSSCYINGCTGYTGIPTTTPNYRGIVSNINYGMTAGQYFPQPICDKNIRATLNTYLKVPADGLYAFSLLVDNAANIYIDGVLRATSNFSICTVNQAVTNVPQMFLSKGYHNVYIEFAQGEGGFDLLLKWSINGGAYQLIPDFNYYYEVPPTETDEICIVKGLEECPVDMNASNDCTDNPIFLSSCGEKVLNSINKLIEKEVLGSPHSCNRTTYPLVLNQAENVNVTGCSGFTTQIMLDMAGTCNGDSKGYALLAKENNSFKLYAGNNAASYESACTCDPGVGYYNTSTLTQEIKFYTLDGLGNPVYIPTEEIAYVKDPFVDCEYARSPGALGFTSSFAVAVKLGRIGGEGTIEITAYVEASEFTTGASYLTWKVPGLPPRTLCSNTYTLNMPTLKNDCIERLNNIAKMQAYTTWKEAEDKFISDYVSEKVDKCFDAPFYEDLHYSYSNNEYHYTLYYYDQAGSLVQTVPPAGVNPLGATAFTSEGIYIQGSSDPDHHLLTKYRYNSLNQVTWESSPDAGEMYYWYDSKGQKRLTQNAKQLAASSPTANQYMYHRYDRQGRVEEVGQIQDMPIQTLAYMTNPTNEKDILALLDNASFPAVADATTLTQRIITVHDAGDGQQENLRGRIAYTSSSSTESTTEVTTRYSYDPHGNVKNLRQDITGFAIKQMDYEYDLISSKLNKIYYQKGQSDQFIHRYEYDADNRMKVVYTSTDDLVWEEEAHYFYFKHGSLARLELGHDKVQGLDYYYTMQGWLKGANIPALRTADVTGKPRVTADIGLDGITSTNNTNKYVGQDEFAYTLGYFNGDYKPIQSGINLYAAGNDQWTSMGTNIKASGLYNGGIAIMTTQIHSMGSNVNSGGSFLSKEQSGLHGYAYHYDQLNRLTSAAHYKSYNSGWETRTTPGAVPQAYDAQYAYDPNGNITDAVVNGQSTALMDNLSYKYNAGGGYLVNNRLNYVVDAAGQTEITDLPGGQSSNNYQYDATGNLISDASEGITNITWSAYGKILAVQNSSNSKADVTFVYDAVGNRVKKYSNVPSGGSKTTYYVCDGAGTVMATYEIENSVTTIEYSMYGTSRIGSWTATTVTNGVQKRIPYNKQYELSNHLGNVLATVSGIKIGVDLNTDNVADYYAAITLNGQDYYPGGMLMPGRSFNPGAYRYGFGSHEMDNDIIGIGNYLSFGDYGYDSRLSRRWRLEPKVSKYPYLSPYSVFENNPIHNSDPNGEDPVSAIFEGLVAFGVEAGLDFLTNMVVNGMDASTAFDKINWKGATYEGVKATAIAVFLPPGSQSAARLAKVAKSKIGKLTAAFVTNLASEAMKNFVSGNYNDADGDFDMDLLQADFENLVYAAGISTLIDAGMTDKAGELFEKLQKSNAKLAKQYEKLYKNLDSRGSTQKTIDNRVKKLNAAQKEVVTTAGKAAVAKTKQETVKKAGDVTQKKARGVKN